MVLLYYRSHCRTSVLFCFPVFLHASCIWYFRVAKTHNQLHIMVLRYMKHFFCFRCKLNKYICGITHNNRTQSKRIGEQFEIGSRNIAIHFGIFRFLIKNGNCTCRTNRKTMLTSPNKFYVLPAEFVTTVPMILHIFLRPTSTHFFMTQSPFCALCRNIGFPLISQI